MAAQKLRPVPTPGHDAKAGVLLARKHPIDLPWMQPVVAAGIPSQPPCSPLSCDGCAACQKAE
ncbi:hypothetical protein DNI29_16915 [Hymenobacter sediminis]|uniref:hypothetical protein n=1 Tax=Hymenobacter sediminis TaxID=2218621 RepID=UPI000DA68780|nr:hypothetical protein [Hymenobacter sediminis]RPD45830.1 hypothetical protein DNI29_16915 [Hymenobacter sediminis]